MRRWQAAVGVLVASALACPAATGQVRVSAFGLGASLASPKASIAETQGQGVGAGAWCLVRFGLREPQLHVGADFILFSGKDRWIQGRKTQYEDRYLVIASLGPRFGESRGLYVVPEFLLSFGSLYDRPGFRESGVPLGVGCRVGMFVPLWSKLSLNLALHLAMTNLLTRSIPQAWDEGLDQERLTSALRICAGLKL
jgi:hypothetical protein